LDGTLLSQRPWNLFGHGGGGRFRVARIDTIASQHITDDGRLESSTAREAAESVRQASVVERHVVPGVSEEGYSVEFFDMTGSTVAVVTVPASALRRPTQADRPTVRALTA
jgi:hypothetical protein